MAQITAASVKELRDRTLAGMADCKKALEEAGGDMEKAADWLRKPSANQVADAFATDSGIGNRRTSTKPAAARGKPVRRQASPRLCKAEAAREAVLERLTPAGQAGVGHEVGVRRERLGIGRHALVAAVRLPAGG